MSFRRSISSTLCSNSQYLTPRPPLHPFLISFNQTRFPSNHTQAIKSFLSSSVGNVNVEIQQRALEYNQYLSDPSLWCLSHLAPLLILASLIPSSSLVLGPMPPAQTALGRFGNGEDNEDVGNSSAASPPLLATPATSQTSAPSGSGDLLGDLLGSPVSTTPGQPSPASPSNLLGIMSDSTSSPPPGSGGGGASADLLSLFGNGTSPVPPATSSEKTGATLLGPSASASFPSPAPAVSGSTSFLLFPSSPHRSSQHDCFPKCRDFDHLSVLQT